MSAGLCRRGLLLLVAVLFLAAIPAARAAEAPRDRLLITTCSDDVSNKAFLSDLKAGGGVLRHSFPPHVAIANLTDAAAQYLAQDPRVTVVTTQYIDPTSIPEAYGPMARDAVSAWNQLYVLAATAPGTAEAEAVGEPLVDDALLSPSQALLGPRVAAPQPAPFGAASWQTSEYLMGSTVISLVLLESNGAIDPQTENWTDAERTNVVTQTVAGANSWISRYPYTVSPLSFTWVYNNPVATSYEPINRPSTDEGLWVTEAMATLGYTTTSGNYWHTVQDYDNDLRVAHDTDWAFTVFVVNSYADVDGKFPDGRFAYAYVGGPFVVMTYDNDGWTISGMHYTLAHEMGHTYRAGDEYCQTGYFCCDANAYFGYLNVQNTNCSSGVTCIMLSSDANAVCSVTRKQLGWQDSDADGVPDILDVPPSATLTPHLPNPTTVRTPDYTGHATVDTYPNQSDPGADCTVNRIAGAQYRVDGAAWQEATASDGAFDSAAEDFAFTTATLSVATHTIEVRALDTAGNWTAPPYASDTLVINTTHSLTVTAAATPSSVGSQQTTALSGTPSDSSEHGIATWSWSDGGAGGAFAPSAAVQNPTYTAPSNTSGSDHAVTLTVTATCSGSSPLTASDTTILTVHSGPTADFTATPTSGPAPLQVNFTDTTTGGPTSWSWNFGDGGTSTARNPAHTYAAAGSYTVSLTATSPWGSGTKSVVAYIHVLPPAPVANFVGSPLSGNEPLTVAFTDLSTNSPTYWLWDFGDGGSSELRSPSHRYASAGSYTVSLTVSNGLWDAETKTNYITVLVAPPTAAFSGTPTRGHVPLNVSFSDLSTGTKGTWSWDFGDGGLSALANPAHAYATPGRYAVGLTVTNSAGTDTLEQPRYITVSFTDVPLTPADAQDFWALNQILACVDAGVVKGYRDGSYQPKGQVTRGQMAAYIARAMCDGEANVPSGPATPTFTDVGTGYGFYRHIEYAVAHGVVTGYAFDNTYRPEEPVTRGQMAAFLARALRGGESLVPPGPATPSFPDVATDFKFYNHIEWIYVQGITTGKSDGLYHPEEGCLRDQMAVFITRAFGLP